MENTRCESLSCCETLTLNSTDSQVWKPMYVGTNRLYVCLFLASMLFKYGPSFSPCVSVLLGGLGSATAILESLPAHSGEIFTCFRISSHRWVNTYRNRFKTNIWYMAPHKCSRPHLFVLTRVDWWNLTVCLCANSAWVCLHVLTYTSFSACKLACFSVWVVVPHMFLPERLIMRAKHMPSRAVVSSSQSHAGRACRASSYQVFTETPLLCFLAPGDLFVFKGLEVKSKRVGRLEPGFIFAQHILTYIDTTALEFQPLVICK